MQLGISTVTINQKTGWCWVSRDIAGDEETSLWWYRSRDETKKIDQMKDESLQSIKSWCAAHSSLTNQTNQGQCIQIHRTSLIQRRTSGHVDALNEMSSSTPC